MDTPLEISATNRLIHKLSTFWDCVFCRTATGWREKTRNEAKSLPPTFYF